MSNATKIKLLKHHKTDKKCRPIKFWYILLVTITRRLPSEIIA